MAKRILTSMLFIALFCAGGPIRAQGADYRWPLSAKPALTSTFGEYRPGRFHAGVDLKTWGREGYPAVAVDDGYVWRVRTSPWGYGKVVYLRLRDGRTAIYAHLSAFSPAIAALVEAEQERRVAYSVNLFLNRDRIPVKRGDTVGFSGSTGIGVPHLHFELRDGAGRPINPLMHGFDVKDTTAPTIRALALLPLEAAARVSGGHAPYAFDVRWSRKRRCYLSSGRIAIEGRIGVAVKTYDRADASALSNRLAPCRLRLLVDGKERFQVTYSSFGYDKIHQVELDRNFALNRRGVGRFHNLFRKRGNRLPLYAGYRVGDGVLYAGVPPQLAPGPHRLQVVVEDAAGNRSIAEAEVLVDAHPRVLNARTEVAGDSVRVSARVADADRDTLRVTFDASSDGGKTWRRRGRQRAGAGSEVSRVLSTGSGMLYRVRARDPHGLEAFQTCALPPVAAGAVVDSMLRCEPDLYPDFAAVRIASDRLLSKPPRVTARWPGGKVGELEVRQRGLRSYEAVAPFDPSSNGAVQLTLSAVDAAGRIGRQSLALAQQRVQPSRDAIIRSEDTLAEARFGPEGVYRTLFARVTAEEAEGEEDLPLVGMAYRFAPDDVPFNGRAEVVLRYPEGFDRPERLGVYEREEDGAWKFVDNTLLPDAGAVSAKVRHFSTYALLLDEIPPEVDGLRPKSGAKIADRRPALSASLRDRGSGIGREEDISVQLDGSPLVFEYDPEEERVDARPVRPLSPGQHRLEVTVRDLCGNQTRKVSVFTVR